MINVPAWLDVQCFAVEAVDNVEDPEASLEVERIGHEICRSHRVGASRHVQQDPFTLELGRIQSAVFRLPRVLRRHADASLPANVLYQHSGVGLLENRNNLGLAETRLLHAIAQFS